VEAAWEGADQEVDGQDDEDDDDEAGSEENDDDGDEMEDDESEEDEEGGQAGAVRQPGRHDGREHRGRADQQVESEGARCHTFSIRAGRGVLVKAYGPERPPGDRRCR